MVTYRPGVSPSTSLIGSSQPTLQFVVESGAEESHGVRVRELAAFALEGGSHDMQLCDELANLGDFLGRGEE